jgi:hypothetical protein
MKPEWKKEAYKLFKAKATWHKIAQSMWHKQPRNQWVEYGYSKMADLKNDLKLYIENWSDI